VLKEPRISGLLPYWIVAATGLGFTTKFAHILRNPADVAASLENRDGLSVEQSLALWLKYNVLAERGTRGARRVFLSYEDLMGDWEAVASRCIAELGGTLAISDETRTGVAQFLSPQLHHHSTPLPGAASHVDSPLGDWVTRSYQVLTDAARGLLDARTLDEIWTALTAGPATVTAV
jgi:hypothetical protein